MYCPDPIAAGILRDTIFCYLDSSGAAIDQARVVSYFKTDIDGIARPTGVSSDIDARELRGLIKMPYSDKGSLPKSLLVRGFILFMGAVMILVFRNLKKAKVKKTAYLFDRRQEMRINFSKLSSH